MSVPDTMNGTRKREARFQEEYHFMIVFRTRMTEYRSVLNNTPLIPRVTGHFLEKQQ
jgi:hypothetical protein